MKFDPNALAGSPDELRLDFCYMLTEMNAAINLRRLAHDLSILPYGSDDREIASARRVAVEAARELFKQSATARSSDGSPLEKPHLAIEAARLWFLAESDGFGRAEAAHLTERLCSDECVIEFVADRPEIDVPTAPGPRGDSIDSLFARAASYLALQQLRPHLDLKAHTEDALEALQGSPFDREVLNDAGLDLAQARAMTPFLRASRGCDAGSLCARLEAAEHDMEFQAGLRMP